jgi:hypothetical protein
MSKEFMEWWLQTMGGKGELIGMEGITQPAGKASIKWPIQKMESQA